MQRFTAIVLFLLLGTALLSGCGQAASSNRIRIVCTTFPPYDWVRQIIGEDADGMELTLLLDKGVDLHSFQPSVDDIVKLSSCDLFIYTGGESDSWVEDALRQASNKDMIAISLLEALGAAAKTEEVKEGMEDDDHAHADDDDHDHHERYDEHVWLSLKNAQVLCTVIADALSALDAGHAEAYHRNLAAYVERLSALDAAYHAAADAAPVKTLLFGDRFPFRYLTDDYGLDYHAAFVGCSAETEASFDTIVFLAEKVDTLSLKHIVVTESADQSIANTVRNSTKGKNQQILVLDSMQSVTLSDAQNGAAYLSTMEDNLRILKEALQ